MTSTPTPSATPGTPAASLRERIDARTAVVGIVGLGYVGLPLARAVHTAGFPVLGYDVDAVKIERLQRGEAYIEHLGQELFDRFAASDRFEATADPTRLARADVILLCVPTPLGAHREPDLRYVRESTRLVADVLRPGQLVVLESTTYPGTTREEMLPILAGTGLTPGKDFFLGYSPEREDPGRTERSTEAIPKLVGAVDPTSLELTHAVYDAFVEEVHAVSSAEVAEAAKILENVYRAVNIALVNELKVVLDAMDIDVWEVIEAASTKPFGFQPFYPGPGLGGHCIPIDPFYLAWRARAVGQTSHFIELAGEVNAGMPQYVVSRLVSALNDDARSLRGARVLVLGIAYKKDIDDIRESPAAEIIDRLHAGGAEVSYHDPHIAAFPPMRHHDIDLHSVPLTEETLRAQDAVLIVTAHAAVDYELVGRCARLVVDSRNAMARVREPAARVVKG